MPDTTQPMVRVAANTATETLRSLVDIADRDEARRMYTELKRITRLLEEKHHFGRAPKEA
jgi:hypothetical protein